MTALKEELRAILRRVEDARFDRKTCVHARIGATELAAAATGSGAKKAERAAAALCERVRPAALIGAGVAGGLTPELTVGDLIVSRRVRDSRGEAPPPDERLLSRALQQRGAIAGTLWTVERPVVGAEEKARLVAALGSPGPAAADMESAGWARAAFERRIPYVVVRSISDLADGRLPAYLAHCVGRDGGIRRSAVVAHAFARPATIPSLLQMRRRLQDCSERLALFLEGLLSGGL